MLAALAFWVEDFALNAAQGPTRTLVTDLTPKEFIYGKLGGIFFNTKEMVVLPLVLCGYLWLRDVISLENLVYLSLGWLVLVIALAASASVLSSRPPPRAANRSSNWPSVRPARVPDRKIVSRSRRSARFEWMVTTSLSKPAWLLSGLL